MTPSLTPSDDGWPTTDHRDDRLGRPPATSGRPRPGDAPRAAEGDRDESKERRPAPPDDPDDPGEKPSPPKKARGNPSPSPKVPEAVEVPAKDPSSPKAPTSDHKAPRPAATDRSPAAEEEKSQGPHSPSPSSRPPPRGPPSTGSFPSTWAERFSTTFLPAEVAGADLDAALASNLAAPIATIAERVERMREFATLSIASGVRNETILIHNVNGTEEEEAGDPADCVGLVGSGKIANLVGVNLRKAFGKRHNVEAFKAAFLMRNAKHSNVCSLRASCPDDIETTSVINAFQSPPWLTAEIWRHNLTRAEDIFIVVLVRAIEDVQQRASKDGTTVEETMTALERDDQLPFGLLLRTLHDWSTLPKALGSCLSIATSPEATEIHEDLHETLRQDPPPNEAVTPSFLRRRRQSLPGFCGEPEEGRPLGDAPPRAAPPGETSAPSGSDGTSCDATDEQPGPTFRGRTETAPGPAFGPAHGSVPGPTQRPTTADRHTTFALDDHPPEPLIAEPRTPSPFLANPIEKLVDCVTSLAKMQEASVKQQGEFHQRKIDGSKTIHKITSNFVRRAATPDGLAPADTLSPLAEAMLSAKDKGVALELFYLELADRGVRCQITPAFFEALFTGSFLPKTASSSQAVPPASSFGCATSFAGTRLEETDIALAYRKLDDKASLTDKEKQGLYSQTVLVCTTASQLTRAFRITAHAFQAYMPRSRVADWHSQWHSFVMDEEEEIADAARTSDPDLPAKIQAFVALVAARYFSEARFSLPSKRTLDTGDEMEAIKRRTFHFSLPAAVENILRPPNPPSRKQSSGGGPSKDRGSGSRSTSRGGARAAPHSGAPAKSKPDTHSDGDLKKGGSPSSRG